MIGLAGFLWDKGSSFLEGCSQAPPLIREALESNSANLYAENGVCIDHHVYKDLGDYKIDAYLSIEDKMAALLETHPRVLSLGGDHSITYPILRAYAQKQTPFDILQIDAHGDLYDNFEGNKYSHACPFARIMEEKLSERLIQVGIRTLNDHQRTQVERFDVEVIEMKFFKNAELPKLEKPVYLSLDLDAMDPAFVPGVSHQEPGGLTTREVIDIIHKIDVPLIGADIVEYNPTRDINGVTGMVAAKLLREIMGHMSAHLLPLGTH